MDGRIEDKATGQVKLTAEASPEDVGGPHALRARHAAIPLQPPHPPNPTGHRAILPGLLPVRLRPSPGATAEAGESPPERGAFPPQWMESQRVESAGASVLRNRLVITTRGAGQLSSVRGVGLDSRIALAAMSG